jgi:hypothetical protein
VTPFITWVFNGSSRYTIQVISIKFSRMESMPYILILVLQSSLCSRLALALSSLLTLRSRVVFDSIWNTTIPEGHPNTVEIDVGGCALD